MNDDRTYDRSFDELRTGFTAAVSHELRTPLARILVLLDSAELPGADVHALIDQAKAEVENAGALIDEILFLSELESGREVVSLGHTTALPVLEEVVREHEDAAARAGVEITATGDPTVDVPLRPRMVRMLAENLLENAIRYAGHGSHFTFTVERAGELSAASLRAVLPRRCRTHVAGHRPRPRDRQARRRGGRWRRGSGRRPRSGPPCPLHVPCVARATTSGSA